MSNVSLSPRHRILTIVALLAIIVIAQLAQAPVATAAPVRYAGVNLAGADFGEGNLPGTFGVDYTYPTSAEVDHFMSRGMNVFRLPFRWERLQRSQNAAFDATEQGRMDTFVNYATGKGASVVLDPHNYARYFGGLVGSAVPNSAFADFWTKLANKYKANSRVIFALVNEPNTMPTEQWRDAAQAGVNAIRATGATNLILVPGNAWTGAHSWFQNWYGTPNATVMISITDPGNNFAFEFHQYFDADFSGTQGSCVSGTVGSEKLAPVTTWLRQNGKKGFLGEFGGWQNSTCYAAIDNILDHIDANADVWLGWTYWAAGPWWPANDQMTIEPANGQDKPQMASLLPHLSGGPVITNTPVIPTRVPTTPAASLPDLIVSSLLPGNSYGAVCQGLRGTRVTVQNNSTINATGSFIVRLTTGSGATTEEQSVNGLAAGQSVTLQYTRFNVGLSTATVDATNLIAESNETNNTLSLAVDPIPPTTPPATCTPTGGPTRVPTTAVPTRVPTRVPTTVPTRVGTTAVPTRVPTTAVPTRVATTAVPTRVPTTVPTSSGSTCSPVNATITAPFTFDGTGVLCWRIASFTGYMNNWNLTSLTINGVNFTSMYVTPSQLPAKAADGYWYIAYNSPVPWGHFEVR